MTTILENKHIKITQEEVSFPNGDQINDYYLVEKRDYVAIVPLINDIEKSSNIILVEQYRPALKQSIWNIPMGFIDNGETPKESAKRELAEETGYEGKLKLLDILAPAPGFYKSICYLYVAYNCQQINTNKKLDTEIQNVKILEWYCAFNRLKNSKGADMTSVAGLLLIKEKHAW